MDQEFNWAANTWDIIDKPYSDQDFLMAHQIDSFNTLVSDSIPRLIQMNCPIVVEKSPGHRYELTFLRIYMSRPVQHNPDTGYQPVTPHEARIRDLTYASPVFVDYEQKYINGSTIQIEVEQKVPLFKLPVMLGSKFCHLYGKTVDERVAMNECRFDRGGYFIVNGNEKVVIAQERPVDNKIMLFKEGASSSNTYIARAEVKSTIDQRFYPIKPCQVYLTKAKTGGRKAAAAKDAPVVEHVPGSKFEVGMPHIGRGSRNGTPLFIVFRALGVISDRDIMEMILGDLSLAANDAVAMLIPSAYESGSVATQLDAINYIAQLVNYKAPDGVTGEALEKLKLQYTKDIINREFIPHVGQDNAKKARFLAHMVRSLMAAMADPVLFSDRDHYSNKRVDATGPLLLQIIRYNFQRLIRELKVSFVKELESPTTGTGPSAGVGDGGLNPNVRKILQKCNIESRVKYALSTGNWHTSRAQAASESKKGIAQVLQRLSRMGSLAHCRRIQSPLERSGSKHEPPRRYHPTQLGKICPNETPEGQQIGIVKNMSMLCHMTIECSSYPVRWILTKLGITDICKADPKIVPRSTTVFVNGDLIGIIDKSIVEPSKVYKALKMFKLNGKLGEFTSISWVIETNSLLIYTDGGRYCRPMYIIDEDNHFKLDYWVSQSGGQDAFAEELKKISWNDLKQGRPDLDGGRISQHSGAMIEYVDTNEDECNMYAIFPHELIPGRVHRVSDSGATTAVLGYKDSVIQVPAGAGVDEAHAYIKSKLLAYLHPYWDQIEVTRVLDQANSIIELQLKPDAPMVARTLMAHLNKFIYPTFKRITHHELHPAMWHSAVAQMIPFPDHNQSPRNCYQSSMGKQALGIYATNYAVRVDTMANILTYPQNPLVQTRTTKYTNLDEMPHGYQAIVAIMCYTGYNQEDSVLCNLAAMQRGMFNSIYYRTYSSKLQKHKTANTAQESFGVPPDSKTVGRRVGTGIRNRYHAVDGRTGRPQIGSYVEEDDVIIAKYKRAPGEISKGSVLYDDASTLVKESGIIDMVIPDQRFPNNENAEGYPFLKARVSVLREPEVGDKLASRSAQKGTIGMLYPPEDMPFTASGIIPDIIMNPHAIPSRMTIAQLIEALLGKTAALSGKTRDATPFTEINLDDIKMELSQYGFDYNGNETMYNGQTGEMFNAAIFINPTYYQRLKHMVADKQHCLTMDHEVLTDSGWKYFHELTMSDKIATLKDNELVYDAPIKLFHYPDYDGKIYNIKSQMVDLSVTEEHRMLVSRSKHREWQPHSLVKAKDLVGEHVKYKTNAEWSATDHQFELPACADHPAAVVEMDAWLTYFGSWIASSKDSRDKLEFNQCSNIQVHNYMASLPKGLPEWVWKLSQRQARILLQGILGPKTYFADSDVHYSSSVELANDLMRLCLHAGWSSTLERPVSASDQWKLNIRKTKHKPVVNNGHSEESVVDFKGEVFCLQVPSEVFYVRRNGKCVWTGNSRDLGPVQLLTRQPAEGRSRDGGLRIGEMERDCMIAHGMAAYLKEKLTESSDIFRLNVSKTKSALVSVNPEQGVYRYGGADIYETDEVVPINPPFALSLLLSEMRTILIDTMLKTD